MHLLKYRVFHFIDNYNPQYLIKLNKNINLIYRNYKTKINIDELIEIKNFCKKNKYKIYLANNYKLAIKLRLNGVYLPSFNKDFVKIIHQKKNFDILGSAHNLKEVRIKEKQGVKYLFLSPLFKKNNKSLGIYKFMNLSKNTNLKIVALGGINNENIKLLKLIKIKNISSISYIEKLYE